ncbi:MAG TPA: M14 family metallopeptidase [Chitinophagaceae bacterium]|nr:M14 family metallopeptidase [Chitinophagaceae bacterium]
MKRLSLLLAILYISFHGIAQLKSPGQFLGYPLGSRYTPHYKIVNYVQYVASQLPEMVKVEQYGETNEGRPLLLAYIASKENLANLENIRKNNLRLANSAADKMAALEDAPVIVWLSYNVHGNEPSSSEAAMLTLYELANPANAKTKEWLRNEVIIMDPCINPDGRDRYVHWQTQVQGRHPNANPVAREHMEPWPNGRTNHYNFDLNRDWAWQTQIETQQRLAKYNQWLPQVHVDFHEQGYNAPYYFAPAAEPFHEVITPWQREFQTIIGRNNAKYFDANGWLYFTKERFDLFYPSYGDTYPTYNGAIGMTFEQGGHSRGGLAVVKQDGDTLTLQDRLLHHYTTGLSAVEMASANAAKLVKEYHKYFNAAVHSPSGEFKSYVLLNDGSDKLDRLKTLLKRNGIEWSYANAGSYTGISYNSGKAEGFKTGSGDIVINSNQPRSNLVRVLFERSSKITDSATYDITAWSVPFVYGLKAYAVKEMITGNSNAPAVNAPPALLPFENTYAYVVKWNGLNSAVFLSAILNKGLRVRYAEAAFKVGNNEFDKGALIITRAANNSFGQQLESIIKEAAASSNVTLASVPTGFVDKGFDIGSGRVRFITKPKIALLSGKEVSYSGMGELWHFFDQQLNYPVTLINTEDLSAMQPGDFNVLIIPDGYYSLFTQKEKNEQLKEWVRKGGKIIALENAAVQMGNTDWGFKVKAADDRKEKEDKEERRDDYSLLKKYDDREKEEISNNIAGSIFRVEMDSTHPLAYGYGTTYYTLKQDQVIYEFLKDGWNVGVIKRDNYVSGFTGNKLKEKLKDGTVLAAMDMGRGTVVLMADDPIFRSFWENGKLLLCNAVFLVGQ